MNRLIAAFVLAAAALAPVTAHASELPAPGGQCDGVVDVMCRSHVCQPDELDCGMIPPCLVWVAGVCLV